MDFRFFIDVAAAANGANGQVVRKRAGDLRAGVGELMSEEFNTELQQLISTLQLEDRSRRREEKRTREEAKRGKDECKRREQN